MRNLSAEFSEHLESGTTTLCRLFLLTLSDGRRFAFSDHDQAIEFERLTAAPMVAAQTEQRADFAADSGAMKSLFDVELSREAILAGALDNARLAEYRVNWQDPTQHVLMTTGRLGRITLDGDGFEADWLGLTTLLERSTGRVFSRRCDAEYGDARCGLTPHPGQSCSRSLQACKAFGNTINFRGFPYLLGDDVLQKGVHLTPTRSGGSRYG